jgi:hypothetical protein
MSESGEASKGLETAASVPCTDMRRRIHASKGLETDT